MITRRRSQKKRKTLKRTRHRRRRLRSVKRRVQQGGTESIVNPNAVFARQHPYNYNMCSSVMHPAKSPDFTFKV
jgi:hypothetical protein